MNACKDASKHQSHAQTHEMNLFLDHFVAIHPVLNAVNTVILHSLTQFVSLTFFLSHVTHRDI